MKLYDDHALRTAICNAERELVYINECLFAREYDKLADKSQSLLIDFGVLIKNIDKIL